MTSDLHKNPFYQLAKTHPLETTLDALAASVAHHTWDELYAARRAAYKATDTRLCGDPFSGRVFGDWFGLADDVGFDPETDVGYHGLCEVRDLAHQFLDALKACKGV